MLNDELKHVPHSCHQLDDDYLEDSDSVINTDDTFAQQHDK